MSSDLDSSANSFWSSANESSDQEGRGRSKKKKSDGRKGRESGSSNSPSPAGKGAGVSRRLYDSSVMPKEVRWARGIPQEDWQKYMNQHRKCVGCDPAEFERVQHEMSFPKKTRPLSATKKINADDPPGFLMPTASHIMRVMHTSPSKDRSLSPSRYEGGGENNNESNNNNSSGNRSARRGSGSGGNSLSASYSNVDDVMKRFATAVNIKDLSVSSSSAFAGGGGGNGNGGFSPFSSPHTRRRSSSNGIHSVDDISPLRTGIPRARTEFTPPRKRGNAASSSINGNLNASYNGEADSEEQLTKEERNLQRKAAQLEAELMHLQDKQHSIELRRVAAKLKQEAEEELEEYELWLAEAMDKEIRSLFEEKEAKRQECLSFQKMLKEKMRELRAMYLEMEDKAELLETGFASAVGKTRENYAAKLKEKREEVSNKWRAQLSSRRTSNSKSRENAE